MAQAVSYVVFISTAVSTLQTQYPCIYRLHKNSTSTVPYNYDGSRCFDYHTKMDLGKSGFGGVLPSDNECKPFMLFVAMWQLPLEGFVADATVSVSTREEGDEFGDIVLHGLGTRGSNEAEALEQGDANKAADFFAGTSNPDPNGGVLIGTIASEKGETSNVSMTAYMNSLLTQGGAGQYMAIRFSGTTYHGCDTICNCGNHYLWIWRSSQNGGDSNRMPLTFTSAPERLPPSPPPLPLPPPYLHHLLHYPATLKATSPKHRRQDPPAWPRGPCWRSVVLPAVSYCRRQRVRELLHRNGRQ